MEAHRYETRGAGGTTAPPSWPMEEWRATRGYSSHHTQTWERELRRHQRARWWTHLTPRAPLHSDRRQTHIGTDLVRTRVASPHDHPSRAHSSSQDLEAFYSGRATWWHRYPSR